MPLSRISTGLSSARPPGGTRRIRSSATNGREESCAPPDTLHNSSTHNTSACFVSTDDGNAIDTLSGIKTAGQSTEVEQLLRNAPKTAHKPDHFLTREERYLRQWRSRAVEDQTRPEGISNRASRPTSLSPGKSHPRPRRRQWLYKESSPRKS